MSDIFFPKNGTKDALKVTDFLKAHKKELEDINSHLKDAIFRYSQIQTLYNPDLDAKFQKNLSLLIKAQSSLDFSLKNFDTMLAILGDSKPERYLILNQNRDELRAAGGFPGSVITLELYKGAVTKYEKKDVYYYDWHLYPYKEEPPEGISALTSNYGLRDANYYPEFSESVDKINFFYEKAGGGSVDTVIALNQGIIIDLLSNIG